MLTLQQQLTRWVSAGLIDAPTAERIRAFEQADEKPSGQRWQVLIAVILGGILLGAGVLLFVAAHWDEVSPIERLALVICMLAILHLGAIFAAEKFPAMATTLHGVGTIAAGAAIAMVGQIFNMQSTGPPRSCCGLSAPRLGGGGCATNFSRSASCSLLPRGSSPSGPTAQASTPGKGSTSSA